jgi:hypothetical protein
MDQSSEAQPDDDAPIVLPASSLSKKMKVNVRKSGSRNDNSKASDDNQGSTCNTDDTKPGDDLEINDVENQNVTTCDAPDSDGLQKQAELKR